MHIPHRRSLQSIDRHRPLEHTVRDSQWFDEEAALAVQHIYLQYLLPRPDTLVAANLKEPAFIRRVPGAVLYARPGGR